MVPLIVTAALIWWNERPEDLERCVRGMATIADRLVAVDGAYARYPDATVRSPKAQENAIRRTAEKVGIDAEVIIPDELWVGQVAKRSYALAEASKDSDWVAVTDTDWVITGDRDKARAELEATAYDVVTVPFYTPPGDGEIASGWHIAIRDSMVYLPHLFRSLPEMAVERYHWHFSAKKGNHHVWLWGLPSQGRAVLPHYKLEAPYLINHMTLSRTEKQVRASRAFINDRIMVVALTDQEDDMPELPRPEFDFDTIATFENQRHARRKMSARQRHLLRRQGR